MKTSNKPRVKCVSNRAKCIDINEKDSESEKLAVNKAIENLKDENRLFVKDITRCGTTEEIATELIKSCTSVQSILDAAQWSAPYPKMLESTPKDSNGNQEQEQDQDFALENFDVEYVDICLDIQRKSKVDEIFETKKSRLENFIKEVTGSTDDTTDELQKFMVMRDEEIVSQSALHSKAMALCGEVRKMEVDINKAMGVFCETKPAEGAVIAKFDCNNEIQRIIKLQRKVDKVRNLAMLKNCHLMMCRESNKRIASYNETMKGDLKALIGHIKEYSNDLKTIQTDICESDMGGNDEISAYSATPGETPKKPSEKGKITPYGGKKLLKKPPPKLTPRKTPPTYVNPKKGGTSTSPPKSEQPLVAAPDQGSKSVQPRLSEPKDNDQQGDNKSKEPAKTAPKESQKPPPPPKELPKLTPRVPPKVTPRVAPPKDIDKDLESQVTSSGNDGSDNNDSKQPNSRKGIEIRVYDATIPGSELTDEEYRDAEKLESDAETVNQSDGETENAEPPPNRAFLHEIRIEGDESETELPSVVRKQALGKKKEKKRVKSEDEDEDEEDDRGNGYSDYKSNDHDGGHDYEDPPGGASASHGRKNTGSSKRNHSYDSRNNNRNENRNTKSSGHSNNKRRSRNQSNEKRRHLNYMQEYSLQPLRYDEDQYSESPRNKSSEPVRPPSLAAKLKRFKPGVLKTNAYTSSFREQIGDQRSFETGIWKERRNPYLGTNTDFIANVVHQVHHLTQSDDKEISSNPKESNKDIDLEDESNPQLGNVKSVKSWVEIFRRFQHSYSALSLKKIEFEQKYYAALKELDRKNQSFDKLLDENKRAEELADQIASLQKMNSSLQQQIEDTTEKLRRQEERNKSLLEENEKSKNILQEASSKGPNSIEILHFIQKTSSLESQLAALSAQNDSILRRYQESQKKLSDYEQNLKALREKVMSPSKDKFTPVIPAMDASYKDWVNYSQYLSERLSEYQTALTRSKFILQMVEDERNQLKSENNQQKKALESSFEDLSRARQDGNSTLLKSRIDILTKEVEKQASTLKQLHNKTLQLENEKDTLSKKLKSSEDVVAYYRKYVDKVAPVNEETGWRLPSPTRQSNKPRVALESSSAVQKPILKVPRLELPRNDEVVSTTDSGDNVPWASEALNIAIKDNTKHGRSRGGLARNYTGHTTPPISSGVVRREFLLLYNFLEKQISKCITKIHQKAGAAPIRDDLEDIINNFEWTKRKLSDIFVNESNQQMRPVRMKPSNNSPELRQISEKMLKTGVNGLTHKELVYLHGLVYRAGVDRCKVLRRSKKPTTYSISSRRWKDLETDLDITKRMLDQFKFIPRN